MTKCDFCTKSKPDGKCFWSTNAREYDCKKAIEKMTKVLQGIQNNTKRDEPFR